MKTFKELSINDIVTIYNCSSFSEEEFCVSRIEKYQNEDILIGNEKKKTIIIDNKDLSRYAIDSCGGVVYTSRKHGIELIAKKLNIKIDEHNKVIDVYNKEIDRIKNK